MPWYHHVDMPTTALEISSFLQMICEWNGVRDRAIFLGLVDGGGREMAANAFSVSGLLKPLQRYATETAAGLATSRPAPDS